MPFLIHGIGERSYGMWLLVGSILGQFGLMELGFGRANQRNIVRALTQNDDKLLNTTVSTSLAIYLALAFLACLIVAVVVSLAPAFFEDEAEIRIFQVIVAIQGLQAALEFPIMSTRGILVAKLRYDILAYLNIAKLLGRTLFIVLIVGESQSIVDLSIITFLSEFIVYMIVFGLAWKFCPQLRIGRSFVSITEAKNLFNFGKWVFLITLSNKFKSSIPNYVIAGSMSLGAVSHFAVAQRLFAYTGQIINSMLNIFFPVFTKLHSLSDRSILREKFEFTLRITSVGSALAFGLLLILGKVIIVFWIGEDFLDAYMPLLILCLAGAIIAPTEQCVSLLYAMDKHRSYAWISVLEVVLSLVLALWLVRAYGMTGVSLSVAIPAFLKFIITSTIVNRLLNVSLRAWFVHSCWFFTHLGAILYLSYYLDLAPQAEFLSYMLSGVLFLCIYSITAYYFQLTKEHRGLIVGLLPAPLRFSFLK